MQGIELQATERLLTKRGLHPSFRIDMTPMVDLGFLLITFFILTTTMSEQSTLKLYMPHDGDPTLLGKSKVLTVLLGGNNRIYAYEGAFEEAQKEKRVKATSYNEAAGIGELIRAKQRQMQEGAKGGKDELVYLIKPTRMSNYRNVIDALDEATINGVKKYMLVDASREENQLFRELVLK
jgi:biopolymer transport protein ExbD